MDKAPGPDLINIEILKAGIDLSSKTETDIFNKIWRQENMTTDCSNRVIIKLTKIREI